MKITCKEYNRQWKEKNLGYVVRMVFGKWVVCDGYAPDCESECDENAVFCGYIVKRFNTFEEADNLRNILNA